MHRYKPEGALLSIAVMLAGLLGSRALGSIGVIFFGINALRGVHPREWLKQRWWLFGLIWLALFALSYFWSADKHKWNVLTQVKLPFLLLPLSFALLPHFSQKHLHYFTVILFGLMFSGCSWSVLHLVRDPQFYLKGYGVSHLLPTPAYNDHIAFSTMIAFCVAWGVYQWPAWRGAWRLAGFIMVSFFIAYLHLLAAKTGLAALYIFALAYLIYLAVQKDWRKVIRSVLSIALIVGIAFAAIPTFRIRIYYIAYAAGKYKEGNRGGEYGDIGRVISYRIAAKIIRSNALTGVGAGDMLDEMKEGYTHWYPLVQDRDRLIPHNEVLALALGAGIPCAILFLLWIIAPLRNLPRTRSGAFFGMVWLMLLVPLIVDPFLEVQWGVLVYLLPLLMSRKSLVESQKSAATDY